MSGEPWDILDRLGYELRFGKPFGTFDSELNLLCETFFRREIDEARSGAEEVLDKKSEPVRLSKDERTEYLAGGLFAGNLRRKSFQEALEGWR